MFCCINFHGFHFAHSGVRNQAVHMPSYIQLLFESSTCWSCPRLEDHGVFPGDPSN